MFLFSPTPKTASPAQSSKSNVVESQAAAAQINVVDREDRRDDVASPTKEPTPPRPRYTSN